MNEKETLLVLQPLSEQLAVSTAPYGLIHNPRLSRRPRRKIHPHYTSSGPPLFYFLPILTHFWWSSIFSLQNLLCQSKCGVAKQAGFGVRLELEWLDWNPLPSCTLFGTSYLIFLSLFFLPCTMRILLISGM